MLICSKCGRDIDAIGQDNVSYNNSPLCEDCAGMNNSNDTITDMELANILRRENENLKNENMRLKEYISNIDNKAKELKQSSITLASISDFPLKDIENINIAMDSLKNDSNRKMSGD